MLTNLKIRKISNGATVVDQVHSYGVFDNLYTQIKRGIHWRSVEVWVEGQVQRQVQWAVLGQLSGNPTAWPFEDMEEE